MRCLTVPVCHAWSTFADMGDWTPAPKRVTRVLQQLATSTQPLLVETDRGDAFIKLPSNREGPHALACDLVGTRLAEWLQLPTFELALIEVPDLELPGEMQRPP